MTDIITSIAAGRPRQAAQTATPPNAPAATTAGSTFGPGPAVTATLSSQAVSSSGTVTPAGFNKPNFYGEACAGLHTLFGGEFINNDKGTTLDFDPSLPGIKENIGHLHPSSIVQYEIEDIFAQMGFGVYDGPQVESEYYNFTALNTPNDHPARDSQDTFWLEQGLLLRSQTSNLQVRMLEKYGAPFRGVFPGRVFRNEATDASHDHTFYQLEGLMVDKNINIGNLIAVMKSFLSEFFNTEVDVRLRPGFFPFVEPGVNGEVSCFLCHGVGCRVCKQTGWLEILGAGMIHPNVLKEGEIDPKKYQGFAFGFGLDRLVMLKYGIENIRLLQEGNLRFLKQF